MIFAENDRVIYRENGTGPERHGIVIGTGHSIEDIFIVKIPKINGIEDCVTAVETDLTKVEKKERRYSYKAATERELEKEKR